MKRIYLLVLALFSVMSTFAVTKEDGYLSVGDQTVEAGTTIQIPVSLTNTVDIYGVQCDIYLSSPELSLKVNNRGNYVFGSNPDRVDGQTASSKLQSDGAVRYLLVDYTAENPFYGNSGELFYINVDVADTANGEYTVALKNITLATDEEKIVCDDIVCTLTVSNTTGITGVMDGSDVVKYDLSGRMVNGNSRGVVIMNNKKVYVK